jgi:DNA (cytosine-5)-methyltransferase 1
MRYKGETFRSFVWQLEQLGYTVDWRELAACDYGAPTTRKRFVLIARNDGRPIVWPEATHGDPDSEAVRTGRLSPWKTAAEVVDFSLPCPSIFATKEEVARAYGGKAAVRPLADNTMCRIARGVDKFTIKSESPYFMAGDDIEAAALTAIGQTGFSKDRSYGADKPVRTIVSKAEQCLVKTKLSPCIIQYHSERSEYVRAQSLDKPLFVVDAAPRYAMAVAQMVKYYGQGIGQRVNDPMHTITVKDREALILSHIVKFKGQNLGQSANGPLQTITANAGEFGEVKTYLVKVESMAGLGRWPEVRALLNRYCGYSLADDELLLFNIDGAFYFIVDIGLRMLTPRELFNAQGFLSDYEIDFSDEKGRPYSKSEQVARCGNAVCPPLAEALVRANLPDKAIPRFRSMRELRAFLAA